jgi:hypothetical protein
MDSVIIGNSAMINNISIVVQAAFTILLVWATLLLAKHTKVLARITKKMADIEEERDKRERDQIRLRAIENLIELSEIFIAKDAGYYGSQLYPGASLKYELFRQMREMALLKKYIDDEQTVKNLEELIQYIHIVDGGTTLEENERIKAIGLFENFQKRLFSLHLDKWREQLTVN